MFYYPINLHYSQTMCGNLSNIYMFYYPINLHYSQTRRSVLRALQNVLLPYKFTLLSNNMLLCYHREFVLLPYKFTLLSNLKCQIFSLKRRHYSPPEIYREQNYLFILYIIINIFQLYFT